MRVLMAAGGTGGHLIPAIRIAEAIARQCRDAEFLFVGSDRGFEERVVTARGYRFIGLPARGLSRRRWWRNGSAAWNNFRALRSADKIVKYYSPMVAVGCGGYASYFPIRVCRRGRIPYALQEQNCFPGLATRWLSQGACVTFTAFADTRRHLPAKANVELAGNPVDPRLATMDRITARRAWNLGDDEPVVLVTGGSTGAQSINRNVAHGLATVAPTQPITVLWQTGEQGAGWDGSALPSWTVRTFAFTDQMTEAFVAADLIVSRAGALTISEITAAGRPAILIPYPLATAGHQMLNAQALADGGGGIVLEDSNLNSVSLLSEMQRLLTDQGRLGEMGRANRALGRPDAADTIAARVIALTSGG